MKIISTHGCRYMYIKLHACSKIMQFIFTMRGNILKYLLPILACGLFLSACDNNTGSTSTNQGSSDVSISYSQEIPILSSQANNQFSVMLYNDGDGSIRNVAYSIDDVYFNGQTLPRDTYDIVNPATSCSSIAAHSSCELHLISKGELPSTYPLLNESA